ncbi:hypothetical protein BsWGS_16963 [Bradybaena similaris]
MDVTKIDPTKRKHWVRVLPDFPADFRFRGGCAERGTCRLPPVHSDERSLKNPAPKPDGAKSRLLKWFSFSKSLDTTSRDAGASKEQFSSHIPSANAEYSWNLHQRPVTYIQRDADKQRRMFPRLEPQLDQRRKTWLWEHQEPVSATDKVKNLNRSNIDGFVNSLEKTITMFDDPSKERSLWPSEEFPKVAHKSRNANHGYGYKDCTVCRDLCRRAGPHELPVYKLSNGCHLSTVRDTRHFKTDQMRMLTVTTPELRSYKPVFGALKYRK